MQINAYTNNKQTTNQQTGGNYKQSANQRTHAQIKQTTNQQTGGNYKQSANQRTHAQINNERQLNNI